MRSEIRYIKLAGAHLSHPAQMRLILTWANGECGRHAEHRSVLAHLPWRWHCALCSTHHHDVTEYEQYEEPCKPASLFVCLCAILALWYGRAPEPFVITASFCVHSSDASHGAQIRWHRAQSTCWRSRPQINLNPCRRTLQAMSTVAPAVTGAGAQAAVRDVP